MSNEHYFVPDATHLPALVRAVHKLGGAVLELGAGWNSTPVLHGMGIQVWTLESDAAWANAFAAMPVAKGNRISHIPSQRFIDEMRRLHRIPDRWQIVFIDTHREFRIAAATIFSDVPLIVAHDTECDYWKPVWSKFKSFRHFNWRTPWVSYLSNKMDVYSI